MEQFKSKQRNAERSDVKKKDVLEFPIPEAAKKLVAGKPYEKQDVAACSERILADFPHHHYTCVCIDHFSELEEYVINISHGEAFDYPRYVLYDKGQGQWVTFCFFLHNGNPVSIHLFYKDSTGEDVPYEVKNLVQSKLWHPIFYVHRGKEQKDNYSAGAFAVRNLRPMLEFIPNWQSRNFKVVKFTKQEAVDRDKVDLMVDGVGSLANNLEFKYALGRFINSLPLDLDTDIDAYLKVLKEETEKGENNMDLDKIKKARIKAFDLGRLRSCQRDFEVVQSNTEITLDIVKRFPKQVQQLRTIFNMLDKVEVNDQLQKLLKTLSVSLEISYEQVKLLYDRKILKEKEIKKRQRLKPTDVGEVIKALKTEQPHKSENNLTPLEGLLANTILGMDETDLPVTPPQSEILTIEQYKEKYKDNKDLCEIERKYHLIKKLYDQNWKDQTAKDIMSWAVSTRQKGLGDSDEDICNCIAAVDRAFKLTTTKFRFRDTQILAPLVFLHNQQDQGKLIQIQTGEGKTLIAGIIAIIKVLQGEAVDIITSNSILARDGVQSNQQLFDLFRLTVATNIPEDNPDDKFNLGYTADVVYGTISNFQFDYLKEVVEGMPVRVGRKYGVVILNEVDNMLIDNGSHIAKLATPFPGMEYLRYVSIKIWVELHKAEQAYIDQREDELKDKMSSWKNQIMVDHSLTPREAQQEYDEWVEQMASIEKQIIKEAMKKNLTNLEEMDILPIHLREYAKDHMEIWVRNAIYAKYECHEHCQYRLMPNDQKEMVVVPIDYMNTGITLRNTIWGNGLHQFVQLKHNLHLTFESLTSSFVSNIGYIKNYQNRNLYGMTGTLGSWSEQNLLKHIYNVEYAKLPTFKPKDFKEVPAIVAPDDDWSVLLMLAVFDKIDEGRAVLVISETEEDVLTLEKDAEILKGKGTKFSIRTYLSEADAATVTTGDVSPGEIILATNIAGRGTNFKTVPELEATGGLHVIVGFLPYNRRVEEQAFGRTARQGKRGTAQLVIRRSEVDEVNVTESDFQTIKEARDELERQRLKNIDEIMVREINFKDQLFKDFGRWHLEIKRRNTRIEYKYYLLDLKEFWAFWLEKKNFRADNIEGTTPEKEFHEFKLEAQKIAQGRIIHNPFYCVSLAKQWLGFEELRPKAVEQLNQAIKMSAENADVMTTAYMSLFEAAIEDGNQVMIRFKDALSKVFFIYAKIKEAYREEAKSNLEKAKRSIDREIKYLSDHFIAEEKNQDEKRTKEISMILIEGDGNKKNVFLTHIGSRLQCLEMYKGHIDKILADFDKIAGGLTIGTKDTTFFNNMYKEQQKKERENEQQEKNNDEAEKDGVLITPAEINEMRIMGLETMYVLKEVHNVPQTVVTAAQAQIGAGLALLAGSWFFPPASIILSPSAGTLISEGKMDITQEILKYSGEDEFKLKDYRKSKIISYGIAIVTMGISVVFSCLKILKEAIELCRRISKALRNVKHLKDIAEKLAQVVDKAAKFLETRIWKIEFLRMSKWGQMEELQRLTDAGKTKRFELLGGLDKLEYLRKLNLGDMKFLDYVGRSLKQAGQLGKKYAQSLLKKKVLKKAINWALGPFMIAIENVVYKNVFNVINSQHLKNLLQRAPAKEVDKVVDKFMKTNPVEEIARKIGVGLLKELGSSVINYLIDIVESIADVTGAITYAQNLYTYLINNIPSGTENNDPNKQIDKLAKTVTKAIVKHIKSVIDRGVSYTQKVVKKYIKLVKVDVGDGDDSGGGSGGNNQEGDGGGNRINGDGYEEIELRPLGNLGDPNRDMSLEENSTWMGVTKNAPKEVIIKRFREMALRLHPDKNPDDPLATKHFQILKRAYQNLLKQRGFD